MVVKLYYAHSSGSSRKARKYLEDNNVEYTSQCMNTEPLSWEQLFEILMYTDNGVEDILSVRSGDYTRLANEGVDFDEITLTELHKLIETYPKLVRAPIIVGKSTTMIGYNEEIISMLGNREDKKKAYLEALNVLRLEEDKTIGKLKTSKWDEVHVG